MIEKTILYSIIGVAVSMAFAFLTKATGKAVSTDVNGIYTLKMNKLYGVLGAVGFLWFAFPYFPTIVNRTN